jgi:predicted nucleic acid-binding protein
MNVLLLDTNIVSILFKPDHTLHAKCLELVSGNQLFISFMTKAELLLWPEQNHWGPIRTQELLKHIDLCTTLFPDEETCSHWVRIISESRSAGQTITTADAWIAATARQWDLPLVTVDYRDFEHLEGLILIPVVT